MPISARMKMKKQQDLNHNTATLDNDLQHQLKQTANFGQNQKNETEELHANDLKIIEK